MATATDPPFYIVNNDGRRITLRLLRKDDRYGDDEGDIYALDEPSVEFFDASGFDEPDQVDILGYFTGIRCLISAVFVEQLQRTEQLNEHFAVWNISEKNLDAVRSWLDTNLTSTESKFINIKQTHKPSLPAKKSANIPDSSNPMYDFEQMMDDIAAQNRVYCSNAMNATAEPHSGDTAFIQQQLENALRALDLAETAENQWQQGDVKSRQHILQAKTEILYAIALLYPPKSKA